MTEYIVPCKINLGLEVLSKRPDGYHEINTVFYRVLEPHDVIAITNSERFRFTCSDSSLVTDSNLVLRAVTTWSHHLGTGLPAIHVHLDKRIPMGAGLGGGSSDAATMLRVLNDYRAMPEQALQTIAASIGADVPFFLSNATAAIATGIGEKLTPIDFELNATILIVYDSSIQVLTREAYEGLHLSTRSIATNFADFLASVESLDDLALHLRNDFEPTIFAKYPKLAWIKQTLYDRGARFALMSGSGSAIVGFFEDRSVATEAKQMFESDGLLAFLA